MFTGIITNTGSIVERRLQGTAGKLSIRPRQPVMDLTPGESIAVNGVCLTLEQTVNGDLQFHVLQETLKCSNLGQLPLSAGVNLERAAAIGDRLGGHLVTGHVDAAAIVRSWRQLDHDWELRVNFPSELTPYLVPKGSVAVDGIALTLVEVKADFFSVMLIPATCKSTCLRERGPGTPVNLETDLIGKYVRHQLKSTAPENRVSMQTLRQAGWR